MFFKYFKLIPIVFIALATVQPALAVTISLDPETKCQASAGMTEEDCRAADQGCRDRYGSYSYFTGEKAQGNFVCECRIGYGWNGFKTKCIPTACPDELVYYSPYRGADGWFLDGRCLTPDAVCLTEYGDGAVSSPSPPSKGELSLRAERSNPEAVGKIDGIATSPSAPRDDSISCVCGEGFEWNADETACQAKPVVAGIEISPEELDYIETLEREKAVVEYWDQDLMDRLTGRILIQVEDKGRAWYLDPVTRFRYYLASPSKAFAVMRERGLGAKHEFITEYQDKIYPKSVRGRILIDVDDHGRAYYISPVEGKGYYLGTPEMAFRVMRGAGLGISNSDIRKIPVE